jgi:hypothetical protein
MATVAEEQKEIRRQVQDVRALAATLDPKKGSSEERRAKFDELKLGFAVDTHPFRQHVGRVMGSFAPGLFSGGELLDFPQDNLDLERWFRQPKGHERRIHGHAHAGVRIVQEGPTLLLALDAHGKHPEPFTAADLQPYAEAGAPPCQVEAIHRRRIMRRARSTKKRSVLLAELEARYQNTS